MTLLKWRSKCGDDPFLTTNQLNNLLLTFNTHGFKNHYHRDILKLTTTKLSAYPKALHEEKSHFPLWLFCKNNIFTQNLSNACTLTSVKALCFKQNLFAFVTILVLLFLSAVELQNNRLSFRYTRQGVLFWQGQPTSIFGKYLFGRRFEI